MKITPSMAVSLGALAISLGGGAYAATGLITSSQIKNGTITAADLSPGLKASLNKPGPQGPRGPQGVPGVAGVAGLPGAAGGFNPAKVTYVTGPTLNLVPGDIETAQAICPAGSKAVGGGFFSANLNGVSAAIPDGSGWQVLALNDSTIVLSLTAFAVCAAQ